MQCTDYKGLQYLCRYFRNVIIFNNYMINLIIYIVFLSGNE